MYTSSFLKRSLKRDQAGREEIKNIIPEKPK